MRLAERGARIGFFYNVIKYYIDDGDLSLKYELGKRYLAL